MTSRALGRAEAMKLVEGVCLGRIAFTIDALPAIRPVSHIVDAEGAVILRGHRGVDGVLKAAADTVVAYSADAIDPLTYVGWSVTLTGVAQMIHSPAGLAGFPSIVRPWGPHEQSYVIRVLPEVVTGVELAQRPDELPTGAR